jgi:hypothetical protein
MADTLPYVMAYGNITKALDRIKTASTPPRFTQDFLATTLNMKGGSARPVIPFLKRTGFLGGDGVPTALYNRFRNGEQSGAAAAEALRTGYQPLYEANEYVHGAKDSEIRGLVVQITGLAGDSSTAKAVVGSFKALRAFADFSATADEQPASPSDADEQLVPSPVPVGDYAHHIKLGYTINLNLPATSDIAVFNAIFKSLREHLLRE